MMNKQFLLNKINHRYFPFLLFAIVIFIAYFRVLFFGLVSLDDDYMIVLKQSYLRNPSNIISAFTTDVFMEQKTVFYRPVLVVSFIVDAFFSRNNPMGYHLTNIIIHVFCSCVLFLLLKKLNYSAVTSFSFTLFFALHPVLTSAVAWIPGRNDSLLTLFILPSFIGLIDYAEKKKLSSLFIHVFFFALSIFTKEVAIAFPFVCIFFILFERKKYNTAVSNILLLAFCWLAIIILWICMRNMSVYQGTEEATYKLPGSVFEALLVYCNNNLYYLGKVFFPFALSPYPDVKQINPFFGIAALILLLGILLWKGVEVKKRVWLGIIWILAFLFPAIVIYPLTYPILFEHRMYLSFFGVIILLAESRLIKKLSLNSLSSVIIFSSIILIFFLQITFYLPVFSNGLSFWEKAVKTSPELYSVHYNLGFQYEKAGRQREALKEFIESIQRKPDNYEAMNEAGAIYLAMNNVAEAEKYFHAAVRSKPDFADALTNLGVIKYSAGNLTEAKKYFTLAIDSQPGFVKAYYNLALVNAKEGKNDDAVENLLKAIQYYHTATDHHAGKDFLARCYQGLAVLYEKKGDSTLSKNYLQKSKEEKLAAD